MNVADRPGLAMAVLGVSSVIGGGLVAAVTAPLQLAHGSWLAAYLVLVSGVGQCAMGAARLVASAIGDGARGWLQLAAWNLGNALVVAGTLVASSMVVDAGGLLCAVALVLALAHSRRRRAHWAVWLYQVGLLLLLVSIPMGLVLSYLRHG